MKKNSPRGKPCDMIKNSRTSWCGGFCWLNTFIYKMITSSSPDSEVSESISSRHAHGQTTLLNKLVPLTWPGAPGSSCSGRAGCKKETGSLPTSSSPPSPPCSPPACWQSRRGQSSSPSGSSCGWRERGRQTKPWVMKSKGTARWLGLFFFFFFFSSAGQHFLSFCPARRKTWSRILIL